MNHRIAHRLAWGAALLFSLYVLWGCYQVSRQVPAMAQLFAGLGSELPVSTQFVIWVSQRAIWPAGGFLVLLVVGKELRLRDAMIRLAITFLAFLAVTWFFSFAVSAMHEPLVGILRQIE